MSARQACNVGICALEVYVCHQMVDQLALEEHDCVPAGKYTIGLGQEAMSVCDEWEDTVSMSLTAVSALLRKYSIDPHAIGRLEVGTESSLDRSKSIKSHLMILFAPCGNTDLPGTDCINACFGATAALFNAVDWVESRAWDGRLALVVAADVAIYAEGPARPTGGCGAVAMLIGPDAPLALERQNVAHHAEHVYDFFKPAGLYPKVDGKLSVYCYLKALVATYCRLHAKSTQAEVSRAGSGGTEHGSSSAGSGLPVHGQHETNGAVALCSLTGEAQLDGSVRGESRAGLPVTLANIDFVVMHSPFHKMVRKAFAWLHHIDQQLPGHAQARPAASTATHIDLKSTSRGAQEDASLQAGRPSGVAEHTLSEGTDAARVDQKPELPTLACSQTAQPSTSCTRPTHRLSCPRQHGDSICQDQPVFSPTLANDKELERRIMQQSEQDFEAKVVPGTLTARLCGNMYTASLYAGLASLVESRGAGLEGRRLLMFSYGSGSIAACFCLRARKAAGHFSLQNLQKQADIAGSLQARAKISAERCATLLDLHRRRHCIASFDVAAPSHVGPGTYYLAYVEEYRRFYAVTI